MLPTLFGKKDALVKCFQTGQSLTYDEVYAEEGSCGLHRMLVSNVLLIVC